MYITEKEILEELSSINKCCERVLEQEDTIREMFHGKRKILTVGSGSSFYVAKSAASMLFMRCGIAAYAVAAGDLLLHYDRYRVVIDDSLVLFISRSGYTSEVQSCFQRIREERNVAVGLICANASSPLIKESDLVISVPWAFDESVCQTKTIGSFYACCAMITAIVSGDNYLKRELAKIAEMQPVLDEQIIPIAQQLSVIEWNQGIVLGDGEPGGLMEEGALAFKEICCINSNYYHMLDVRHGPIVVVDPKTLIIALAENDDLMTEALISDLLEKTPNVVTVGPSSKNLKTNMHVNVGELTDPIAYGIAAIYLIQNITLRKAEALGVDPDHPKGLDACIIF